MSNGEPWIISTIVNRRQVNHIVQESALNAEQSWLYIVGYTESYFETDADAFVARIDAQSMEVRNLVYLEGNEDDLANAVAIDDQNGDVLIAGSTESTDLPLTNGLISESSAGRKDVLLARYSPNLAELKALTIFGGSQSEEAKALLLDDSNGSILIAGHTQSDSFLDDLIDPACDKTDWQDAFVLRINGAFTSLEQAILVGGEDSDFGEALAIDAGTGEIILAGTSESEGFRCTDTGFESDRRYRPDAFAVRLARDLGSSEAVAFFGDLEGPDYGDQRLNRCLSDWARSVAVDPSTSEIFIAGGTCSKDLPGTWNGAQRQFGGFQSIPHDYMGDGYVAKFSRDLQALVRSTYVGGTGGDYVTDISIRPETSDVILSGVTLSKRLPGASIGMQADRPGLWSGFVARLDSRLWHLVGATFVGGEGYAVLNDIALVAGGQRILVSGSTSSNKTYPGLGDDAARMDRDFASVVAADVSVSALGVAQYPDSSYTGTWFFPERNGEGYVLEVLPGDEKPHVLYYLFTIGGPSGQAWFINGSSMTGNSALMEAHNPRGPIFGPDYDPRDLYYQYSGQVLFDFMGCNKIRILDDIAIPELPYRVVRLTPPLPGSEGQCASSTQPSRFALSGSWFNPMRDGEGFVLNLIEREDQTEILVYWFTYAQESGHQAWFIGQGPIENGKATLQLLRPMSPSGRASFDPATMEYPEWGNLTIEFADCENGRIDFSGHEDFEAISYEIERLSSAPGGHFGECVIP